MSIMSVAKQIIARAILSWIMSLGTGATLHEILYSVAAA